MGVYFIIYLVIDVQYMPILLCLGVKSVNIVPSANFKNYYHPKYPELYPSQRENNKKII